MFTSHQILPAPPPSSPPVSSQVLLHVSNPELRARLEALQAADNGADPLRYGLIVSQVALVATADEVQRGAGAGAGTEAAPYCATATLEEGGGEVTVGVARADGHKCNRCWNYRCGGGLGVIVPCCKIQYACRTLALLVSSLPACLTFCLPCSLLLLQHPCRQR